jgi:hypothetical protein
MNILDVLWVLIVVDMLKQRKIFRDDYCQQAIQIASSIQLYACQKRKEYVIENYTNQVLVRMLILHHLLL